MKLIFALGHPAHFHLLYPSMKLLKDTHEIKVLISDKDILKQLLINNEIDFEVISYKFPNESLLKKGLKLVFSSFKLFEIVAKFKPHLIIGSIVQPAFVGFLMKIPYVFTAEDDIHYTSLQGYITYPFTKCILSPIVTNLGIFSSKKIAYHGYQKLAYLHPNRFTPNPDLIPEIDTTENYTIIRLVDLSAYHDVNAKGIHRSFLKVLIEKLTKTGKVYISSEKKIPEEFLPYALPIKIQYMHHALAFANLFIGDSQSMSVEAAVLGVPALKYNDFKGKISVLNELEHAYGITFGFNTSQSEQLIAKIDELLATKNLKHELQLRRSKMLSEKIDVTAFFVWFIENYPESANVMQHNPEYEFNFK